MKKLTIVVVLLIVLCAGCISETVANGGVVIRGEMPTQPPADVPVSAPPGETIVYITETGEKYHADDCPLLTSSRIPVTLTQALMEGRQPCRRCLKEPFD